MKYFKLAQINFAERIKEYLVLWSSKQFILKNLFMILPQNIEKWKKYKRSLVTFRNFFV